MEKTINEKRVGKFVYPLFTLPVRVPKVEEVVILPKLLSLETCNSLLENLEQYEFEPAQNNLWYKAETFSLLDVEPFAEENEFLYNALLDAAHKLNQRNFKIGLSGIYEPFRFQKMVVNDFSGYHTDYGTGDISKLSCIVLISPLKDFEGGRLILNHNGEFVCDLQQGDGVFFLSYLMQSVSPVISGERVTLEGWFGGFPFV